MIRIAILEKEPCAKDLIYEFGRMITDMEWSFVCYTKISQLVKGDEMRNFDMIVLHEMFHSTRVKTSLMAHHPRRLLMYCMESDKAKQLGLRSDRILYIDRSHIKQEMKRITSQLNTFLRQRQEYILSYRHVSLPLQISDIYYIEKKDKNIIYHSARGTFKERKTLQEAETYFKETGFVRLHARSLIHLMHGSSFTKDHVILMCHVRLPIARARKKEVLERLRGDGK